MIVVLASTDAGERVLEALGDARSRTQAFLQASPPLLSVPELSAAEADRIRATPGVVELCRDEGPLLATRRLLPDDAQVRVGPIAFGGEVIPVIAGPCSVEDEAQVTGLAETVKAAGARLLRGGAFKGRTSPYAFQGLGRAALPHLSHARTQTGLPVVTEILSEADVELLAAEVDLLQVGARNMHNTALLKRLGQVRTPVLLKRGFGSTVDELLYAADYILAEGNPHVVLCERGIRSFERGVRFSFDLSAFARLKSRTRLPVVVDPSHAAGDARLVGTLAKAAVAAGADGLLIEVHDEPEQALSDGEQALTPPAFRALMEELRPLAAALGRTL